MNLQELLSENLIEPYASSDAEIKNKISIAEKDIHAAKESVKSSNSRMVDWAHAQVYNAALQIATALMYHKGYRAMRSSGKHHYAVMEFIKSQYKGEIASDVILAIDDARTKRHEAVYDQTGIITPSQVTYLIKKTDSLLTTAKSILKKH